jgi:STE24 endopeptidase
MSTAPLIQNPITLSFFVFLAIKHFVFITSEVLNLRSSANSANEGSSARAHEYLASTTRFRMANEVASTLLLAGFWLFGGFNVLDGWTSQNFSHSIVRGLAFVGFLAIGQSLASLPFSLYQTFVLEERFGFNRTNLTTFLLDRLKGLVLMTLIGMPILSAVFAIFGHFGQNAWFWGWLLLTAAQLLLQFVAPAVIMPLFNKYQPLEAGPLRDKIVHLAALAKFPMQGLYVMDASKRSTKSNAFFTGFGRFRRIVLFDTLIQKHSADELAAVMAHEIGHFKLGHVITGTLTSVIASGVALYAASRLAFSEEVASAFGLDQPNLHSGLVFAMILLEPISTVWNVLGNAWSRRHEYQADHYAVKLTNAGSHLSNALRKLSQDNLSNPRPHSLYVFLHYTHPPVEARVRAIESISNS